MPETNTNINFKTFPTTRYQGSKRKILPWIYENIKDLNFHTALDACGGTGSVSYLLKKMGKAVTYNDKLKFNTIIGKAIIENQNIKLTEDDITTLFDYIRNNPGGNFIQRTFQGIYYLPTENRWLDNINHGIINMNHYENPVLDYKKSIAYYSLFQASIIKRPFNLFHRNNLNVRTNDVVRHFGNKVTWEKTFDEYFLKFVNEANSMVFDSGTECRVINESILDIAETNYDLVYIDPPYVNIDNKNETANYLKCYHFLEGMANYEEWGNNIDESTANRRLLNVNETNDFKNATIKSTFEEIIKKYRNSTIVFSYKKGGIPSIDFLYRTMKKYKRNVTTRSQHYKYALNKQNGNAKLNREVLIIGI